MKNYPISLLLAVLFILMLSSCQKEISEGNGILPGTTTNPTNTALGDSNYLSRITYVQFQSGVSDTGITRFSFDNLKRVKGSSLNEQDYSDTTTYFYNGTEALPFKMIMTSYDISGERDTTIKYFYYNSASLLIRDSTMDMYRPAPPSNDLVSKTIGLNTYSGNKIYRDEQTTDLYDPSGSYFPINYLDTFTLDANRNIIDRRVMELSAGAVPVLTVNHITYDTKPSPYISLNINNIFPIEPGEIDLTAKQLGSKNNRFTWSEELFFNGVSSGSVYHEDLTGLYTYKASGVPSILFVPYPGSTDYDKTGFEYITL